MNGFRAPVPFWKQSDGQQERLRRPAKKSAVFASLRPLEGSGGVIPKAEKRLHPRSHWWPSSTNRNLRLEFFYLIHSLAIIVFERHGASGSARFGASWSG